MAELILTVAIGTFFGHLAMWVFRFVERWWLVRKWRQDAVNWGREENIRRQLQLDHNSRQED